MNPKNLHQFTGYAKFRLLRIPIHLQINYQTHWLLTELMRTQIVFKSTLLNARSESAVWRSCRPARGAATARVMPARRVGNARAAEHAVQE